jgi:GAF domain-containing protein
VTRFRIPLGIWVVAWLIVFSLAPFLIVYAFIHGQLRENYQNARLEAMASQARQFSAQLESQTRDKQKVTDSLTSMVQGSQFFVLGADGKYITHSDHSKIGKDAASELGPAILSQILSRDSALFVDNNNKFMVASFRQTFSGPAAVTISTVDAKLSPFQITSGSMNYLLILGLIGMSLAGGFAVFYLLLPAQQLSGFAKQLGNRDFKTTISSSKFNGELAMIADSLINLSRNIQGLISELEEKVVERTRELEHRAIQLRATAEVGRAITSVRSLTELLQQTAKLIHDRFGYYHVGIFLLDERKKFAVLSASNSVGGRKMLENNYRLRVGEVGLVGYVTETGKARVALDVGQDAVFFDNPDLPNTRSEMALPLVVGGQILGALDVQSTDPEAFSEDDVATLQTLAEQIAVAIQNVNLFNESEKSLESSRRVYGEVSRDAWRRLMRYQSRVGYLATSPGAVQTQTEALETSMATSFETGDLVFANDGLSISIPIKIRGEIIGSIRLKKSEIAESWTQDEINLAIALSDQLSGALESARLFRESQQRAARESLVSDISARITSSSHVEAIVRETVQELGQAIGNAKITFQLQGKQNGSADHDPLNEDNSPSEFHETPGSPA